MPPLRVLTQKISYIISIFKIDKLLSAFIYGNHAGKKKTWKTFCGRPLFAPGLLIVNWQHRLLIAKFAAKVWSAFVWQKLETIGESSQYSCTCICIRLIRVASWLKGNPFACLKYAPFVLQNVPLIRRKIYARFPSTWSVLQFPHCSPRVFEFSFFAFNKIWQIYTSPLAQLTITKATTTTAVQGVTMGAKCYSFSGQGTPRKSHK